MVSKFVTNTNLESEFMYHPSRSSLCLILLAGFFTLGCGESQSLPEGNTVVMDGPPPDTVDAHQHPQTGPHQGSIIDLGGGEYHAELLHDSNSVTVYILGKDASTLVPIESSEILVNLMLNGQPKQFKLSAIHDASATDITSSMFNSTEPELANNIDSHSSAAKLVVLIDGTSYRGELAHNHTH